MINLQQSRILPVLIYWEWDFTGNLAVCPVRGRKGLHVTRLM